MSRPPGRKRSRQTVPKATPYLLPLEMLDPHLTTFSLTRDIAKKVAYPKSESRCSIHLYPQQLQQPQTRIQQQQQQQQQQQPQREPKHQGHHQEQNKARQDSRLLLSLACCRHQQHFCQVILAATAAAKRTPLVALGVRWGLVGHLLHALPDSKDRS